MQDTTSRLYYAIACACIGHEEVNECGTDTGVRSGRRHKQGGGDGRTAQTTDRAA